MINKKTNKSKLLVACNWDYELIKELSNYASDIKYIYGKTKTDVFSGGRPTKQVIELQHREEAEKYIKTAKENNLEFNYILNGTELSNEFSKKTTKKIYENLDWITSIGVKWVTLSNPRIAKIIKDNYPNLNINVSIFAHIRTKRQIEFWEKLGAKSINLDRELIRNKKQLEFLTKNTNVELILLANDPCLLNCPYELYHDNLMSKNSVTGDEYYHYCSFTCMLEYISNPVEIIKSSFIRPEDIGYYEKLGIHNFKIVDRNRTTKYIVNVVKAYVNRKYKGNLIDLMSIYSSFDKDKIKSFKVSKDLNEDTIDKFWKALPSFVDIKLDNSEIQNLLEKTKNIECNTVSCETCRICNTFENKVTFGNNNIDEAKEILQNVIKHINNAE